MFYLVLALISLEPFVCWSSPNRTRFTAEHLLVPCEAFMSRIACTVVGFLQQVAARDGDESTVAREGLCEFTNAWAGPSATEATLSEVVFLGTLVSQEYG